jgi:hypothetical protein
MIHAVGLTEAQPRIDSLAGCGHCQGALIWDEVHGWLHVDGWYACRNPDSRKPREVMAVLARECL